MEIRYKFDEGKLKVQLELTNEEYVEFLKKYGGPKERSSSDHLKEKHLIRFEQSISNFVGYLTLHWPKLRDLFNERVKKRKNNPPGARRLNYIPKKGAFMLPEIDDGSRRAKKIIKRSKRSDKYSK
jgi:hypothetical protein